MIVKYYINELKTNLIKTVDKDVFVYNFIKQEWKENDYWFNEIHFEGGINCIEVKEKIANKIIKGESYVIN